MIEKEVKIVVEYPSLDELRESLEKELKLLDIENKKIFTLIMFIEISK